jgi:preprotein translocase subunit YajC
MSPILGTFPALLMVPREGASAGLVFALNIAAFIAIFYFLLIRPQRQEAKRHQEMLAGLKKGDEIVTNGGIIGTVVHAADDRLTIKSGDNARIVVQRARVAGRVGGTEKAEAGKS